MGLSKDSPIDLGRLKPVTRVLDAEPIIDRDLLGLTAWIAETYACAWGEALAMLLPAPLKREGGRRKVRVLVLEREPTDEELATLEEKSPKPFRILRMLREVGGRAELAELLRKANLSDAPAKTLAKTGLARIEFIISEHVRAHPMALLEP